MPVLAQDMHFYGHETQTETRRRFQKVSGGKSRQENENEDRENDLHRDRGTYHRNGALCQHVDAVHPK